MYQTVVTHTAMNPLTVSLPQTQLCTVPDLTILFTVGGFLLLLVGLGCLSFARRKRRGAGCGVLLPAAGAHRPGFGFHSGPDRLVQPQGAKGGGQRLFDIRRCHG